MELKPIKTESEYQQALQRIEEFVMAQPNIKKGVTGLEVREEVLYMVHPLATHHKKKKPTLTV